MDILTQGQWVACSQSFLLYCKSCVRLKKFDEARDAFSTAKQQSELCPHPSLFDPIIQRIRYFLERSPSAPATARRPHSTFNSMTSRSEHVVITGATVPEIRIESEKIDIIENPAPFRSKSVPPRIDGPEPQAVKYIQSKNALSDDWITCKSTSTGKEYLYNKRTGISSWNMPD
jgi:hypothetical protein